MKSPTQQPFVYDRNFPPLFFTTPNDWESRHWQKSVNQTSKEFFTQVRIEEIRSTYVLSNGMTVGEYCMHIITDTHNKRLKSEAE
jgi:hypothetical protein